MIRRGYVKDLLKRVARQFGYDIRRSPGTDDLSITVQPEGTSKGNVLLSYLIEPFLRRDQSFNASHTYYYECYQIAKTFLDLGYTVDVINQFDNDAFEPKKEYAFCVETYYHLERLAPLLSSDCVKIMHLVWAHWLFNNHAECRRLMDLQQRLGVTLKPKRTLKPNLSYDVADYATILGNEFTMGTYSYIEKRMFPIPISTVCFYPWPAERDIESCRRNFLWFGGYGFVHKGLDLVLEAFADMPESTLYACGPLGSETDFVDVYRRELYETPNIRPIGWVDVTSERFADIMKGCIGIVNPSCSEGQSGAVITGLHGALIPIISRESGVPVGDFGVVLEDCTVESIKKAVRGVSSLPVRRLEMMTRNAWEYARANHTRDRFAEEYRNAVNSIIACEDGRRKGRFLSRPSSAEHDGSVCFAEAVEGYHDCIDKNPIRP